MANVEVVQTPVVTDLITKLRDINTPPFLFRVYSNMLTTFLLYEALKDIKTSKKSVDTQTGKKFAGTRLSEKVVFVAILRASMGMLSTAMNVFPEAEFHVIGMKRNEENAFDNDPNVYLDRLHEMRKDVERIVVMDPMLATAGSMVSALRLVRETHKYKGKLQAISYIASEPGAEVLSQFFPDVKVTCAGLDAKLNKHAFIVPGLGDAGDRYFGLNTDLASVQ